MRQHKSPVSRISNIASLKKFPDKDHANAILHDAAKLVAPIIHENDFKVGTLCEMYPKNPNLLGLNVNKGQKILLRLRYHSDKNLFLPLGDVVGTLLHELTHILHGPHNKPFYDFLDKLKNRFEEIQLNPLTVQNYIMEEHRLGSTLSLSPGYRSVRSKRIEKLSQQKFKAEARRLGTLSKLSPVNKTKEDLKRAILEAAERRLSDSKWCLESAKPESFEPAGKDLEVTDISHDTEQEVIVLTDSDDEEPKTKKLRKDRKDEKKYKHKKEENGKVHQPRENGKVPELLTSPQRNLRHKSDTSSDKLAEYKEVIELSDDDDEIKVIDACEKSNKGIKVFISTPKRSFISDEPSPYPRWKTVADINFEQILLKNEVSKPKPKKKRKHKKQAKPKKEVKTVPFNELV